MARKARKKPVRKRAPVKAKPVSHREHLRAVRKRGAFRSFMQLARIEHAFFLAVAVVVGEIIAFGGMPDIHLILFGAYTAFFIEIGSFAINDYYDLEADRINKRHDRPLVRGDLTKQSAMWVAVISILSGVAFSLFLNGTAFIIATLFSMMAIYYAWMLKKIAFFGNLSIAVSMAVPFLFGNYAVQEFSVSPAVLILALMALLMGFGREIAKSIQDLVGDVKTGRKTLPYFIGKQRASYHAAFFFLLAVFVSPIPFATFAEYYLDLSYLIPVFMADALLIYSAYDILKICDLKRVRNYTLTAMGLGLVGFLLGVLL